MLCHSVNIMNMNGRAIYNYLKEDFYLQKHTTHIHTLYIYIICCNITY